MKKNTFFGLALILLYVFSSCAAQLDSSVGHTSFAQEASSMDVESAVLTEEDPMPIHQPFPLPDGADDVSTWRFAAASASLVMNGQANACYAPLNLYRSLSLLCMGAEGKTQAELLATLHAEELGPDGLLAEMEKMSAALQFSVEAEEMVAPEEISDPFMQEQTNATARTLSLGTSLWVDDEYVLNDGFGDMAQTRYGAQIFSADLQNLCTAAQMGEWVAEQTNGLLTPAVDTDSLEAMCLMDTVYLSDAWVNVFREKRNTEDVFFTADGREVNCTYMDGSNYYGGRYLPSDGFIGMEMPLVGTPETGAGHMGIILPDEDISAVEFLADEERLAAALYQMHTTEAEDLAEVDHLILQMPKFSFGTTLEPKEALKSLGVHRAFSNMNAEFSGIVTHGTLDVPLYISDVWQETHIAVDEDGLEAASYVIIISAPLSATQNPTSVSFILNRPFLFYIEYDDQPVFIGIVVDPTQM